MNVASRVFTNIMKSMAWALSLVKGSMCGCISMVGGSKPPSVNSAKLKHSLSAHERGLLFNFPNCDLMQTLTILLLSITGDSRPLTQSMYPDNHRRILLQVHHTLGVQHISHRLWESLLGSFNYAAQQLPLGWIHYHCLPDNSDEFS